MVFFSFAVCFFFFFNFNIVSNLVGEKHSIATLVTSYSKENPLEISQICCRRILTNWGITNWQCLCCASLPHNELRCCLCQSTIGVSSFAKLQKHWKLKIFTIKCSLLLFSFDCHNLWAFVYNTYISLYKCILWTIVVIIVARQQLTERFCCWDKHFAKVRASASGQFGRLTGGKYPQLYGSG